MSQTLQNFTDIECININNIDLNTYFVTQNYEYSDLTQNYHKYIAKFIINKIKDLLSNAEINYNLIENVISNIINTNTIFTTFFESTSIAPYYNYETTTESLSFFINVNDNNINKEYLIKIYNETPATTTATTDSTATTCTTSCNTDGTTATTCATDTTCATNTTCATDTINNEIIFTKSVPADPDIFDKLIVKNQWKLVSLKNNLDISLTIPTDNNIVIQITAGLKIKNLKKTTYRWGLFNTDTANIDSSTIVYDNICCNNNQLSTTIVKSGFFHISYKTDVTTYNYKWIHMNDKSDDNIQIDYNYPVTIIAWKLQNNINNININYLEHITQKINDLQESYYNLSNRIDSLQ